MTTPDLALTDTGSGRPALVLHGGGGPATVAMITEQLAATMRALQPTHPGGGTARPGPNPSPPSPTSPRDT